MFARHFAANFFNLLVIICIVIAGAVHWAKKQYEIDGPLTSDINFEVKKGDRFKAVAISLEELGIIYNSTIFKIGARYAEQDDELKFGNYLVPRKASMRDVIALITSGRAISEQVTFPEGFTSYQIVERLNAIPELIDTLDTLPMEGSLAPNTYAYIKGDSRKVILKNEANIDIRLNFTLGSDAAVINRISCILIDQGIVNTKKIKSQRNKYDGWFNLNQRA